MFERTGWYSPALGRHMEVRVHGWGGARLIVFPTTMGSVHEWADRGMLHAIAEPLGRGWLQVFAVSSADDQSWYARHRHPHERARGQERYERYIVDELVPFTQWRNRNPFCITAGASFGAYHAVTLALRHPHLFHRAIGMSGLYDITRSTGGWQDDLVYRHNPCAFIPNEHDWGRLDALRRLDLILAIGRDDGLRDSNERLSGALWSKGIGNALRVWDGFAHDWPVWQRMLPMYVSGHD
ncbi:MAG: alpha/beta hydrolase-fold protein [Gemmatimonadaceae bacterium]|nr:alpha/beta hydrolase-fold protein [Gemmatimonadaceae bacterium]